MTALVDPDGLQNIGDQPRHDRLPSTVPLVRSPVAEEWYDRRNARGSGAAASIGQSKKLDQVIACRRRGRLHQKDLSAAHAFK
jgi:hypothetical protein